MGLTPAKFFFRSRGERVEESREDGQPGEAPQGEVALLIGEEKRAAYSDGRSE